MNWRLAGVAAAIVAAFIGGYQYAAALYEKDAADLREAEAVARADLGRKQYAKLVASMDALAGLRGELADARADAERPRYVSEEPAPLPAVLSAPQSQRAKAYSEKVSSFSQRVESYFKSQPEFTTQ